MSINSLIADGVDSISYEDEKNFILELSKCIVTQIWEIYIIVAST